MINKRSETYDILYDGILREYLLSVPPSSNSKMPLIISLHGFTNNPEVQQDLLQMDDYAFENNIVVVYPKGYNKSWNVGTWWDLNSQNDIGFIDTVIDDIISNFFIDQNRIYAFGYSNGGYMTYDLMCHLSHRITAFGSLSGNFMQNAEDVIPERDLPIIHIHGINDGVIDYYPPAWDNSITVIELINIMKKHNNLNLQKITTINDDIEKQVYYKKNGNTKFVHYKIIDGHYLYSNDDLTIDVGSELINFFLQYSLDQFIKNNYSITINSGWNLIGLPGIIKNTNIDYLLPNTILNTLYLYNCSYINNTSLVVGNGYWIKSNNDKLYTVTGYPLLSVEINLLCGWNLISGISTSINASTIYNNTIIIANTLFGFNKDGYFLQNTIEPGNGYWIRASEPGTITITNNN